MNIPANNIFAGMPAANSSNPNTQRVSMSNPNQVNLNRTSGIFGASVPGEKNTSNINSTGRIGESLFEKNVVRSNSSNNVIPFPNNTKQNSQKDVKVQQKSSPFQNINQLSSPTNPQNSESVLRIQRPQNRLHVPLKTYESGLIIIMQQFEVLRKDRNTVIEYFLQKERKIVRERSFADYIKSKNKIVDTFKSIHQQLENIQSLLDQPIQQKFKNQNNTVQNLLNIRDFINQTVTVPAQNIDRLMKLSLMIQKEIEFAEKQHKNLKNQQKLKNFIQIFYDESQEEQSKIIRTYFLNKDRKISRLLFDGLKRHYEKLNRLSLKIKGNMLRLYQCSIEDQIKGTEKTIQLLQKSHDKEEPLHAADLQEQAVSILLNEEL